MRVICVVIEPRDLKTYIFFTLLSMRNIAAYYQHYKPDVCETYITEQPSYNTEVPRLNFNILVSLCLIIYSLSTNLVSTGSSIESLSPQSRIQQIPVSIGSQRFFNKIHQLPPTAAISFQSPENKLEKPFIVSTHSLFERHSNFNKLKMFAPINNILVYLSIFRYYQLN